MSRIKQLLPAPSGAGEAFGLLGDAEQRLRLLDVFLLFEGRIRIADEAGAGLDIRDAVLDQSVHIAAGGEVATCNCGMDAAHIAAPKSLAPIPLSIRVTSSAQVRTLANSFDTAVSSSADISADCQTPRTSRSTPAPSPSLCNTRARRNGLVRVASPSSRCC